MNRWSVILHLALVCMVAILGCSGNSNTPITPQSDGVSDTGVSQAVNQSQNTRLMGYFDIFFDVETETFEAIESRTAEFTLNVVPFLNKMTSPQNGITFGYVSVDQTNPGILGVDVEFQIHHPFPGIDQYLAYDLMGVVIGDGSDTLNYENLRVGHRGTDLWMKNADGFTRWDNPTEFTSELIFGYAPGGIQNYAGNAILNPFKYYAKGLEPDDDLWGFLTGGSNNEGVFQSADGRMMELEFVMPPAGIGLMFGYAVVCCWEEQGPDPPGGYTPYHRDEAITANVAVTPDIYYNEIDGSGGSLILDIDLFAWEEQPSVVKIESSVLTDIEEFDFDTYAGEGGEHYSTWHVEAEAKPLNTGEGHYFWIIAESQGYDYKNGLPQIPSPDGYLAAFFRYDLDIMSEPECEDLVPDVQTLNGENPFESEAGVFTGWTVEGTNFEGSDIEISIMDNGSPVAQAANVILLDSENVAFDIDLTGVQSGIYDLAFTNGCGAQEEDYAEDILIVCSNLQPGNDSINGENPVGLFAMPLTDLTMEGSNFEPGNLVIEVEKDSTVYAMSSSVTFVDSNNLLFDIDLSDLDWDIYDVRLTNGCGDQLQDLAVAMLEIYNIVPVGTPNVDVSHGGVPKDLGINPSADETAISYNAPKFRQYSDNYTVNTMRDSWFNDFSG